MASIAIERQRFEAELEYQALHDGLTGLPNRTLVLDRVSQSLARSSRRSNDVAVIFIDLDRFKLVNDGLGHGAGDELLCQVAERFSDELRSGDTVGRFGGDEFVLVIEEVAGEAGALDVAERLGAALRPPFTIGTGEVRITASVGVALSDDEEASADALIRDADAAMYRAKENGRDRVEMFADEFRQEVLRRLDLEAALRVAIANDELILHYQPVIDLKTEAMIGVEALVRWERPGHGIVSPGEFIPVAEETGLIVPLGAWVIREACREAAGWPRSRDGKRLKVSINLSTKQLAAPGLLDMIETTIQRFGLEPSSITFEVTESTLVDDVDMAISTLTRLKEIGVTLAIDDFGTGYASLDYVRKFHMADYLKIDRCFVEGVSEFDSHDAAIVSSAIVLAKAMRFEVVAEGIETQAQLDVLRQLDCELGQGWLFAPALPADRIVEMIERNSVKPPAEIGDGDGDEPTSQENSGPEAIA